MYNCGNARLGKTSKAQDWTITAFYELHKHEATFKEFRDVFDPVTHYYSMKIVAFYPIKTFKAAKKGISQRTHDVSNFEKPLIDLIFLAKHCEYQVPYGFQNLCIDDKFLAELHSSKKATKEDSAYIIVEIEIKELTDLIGDD